MNIETLLLAVVATGAGAAVEPAQEADSVRDLPVTISGITTATVVIEGSLDGSLYEAIVSKTADAAFAVPYFPYIRANCTAWTSGAITVKIGY